MRGDGTHRYGARPLSLPVVAALVLLASAWAGADVDPNDRYSFFEEVGNEIAPKVAQAITWGIVESVAGRVDTVGARAAEMERLEAAGVRRFGLPKLTSRLISDGIGPMPLLVADDGETNGVQGRLWGFGFAGGADYRSLGRGADTDLDGPAAWNGYVANAHLSFDVRPIREMMTGVVATGSQGDFIYADGDVPLDHRMIAVSPYVSWILQPGLWWWATATYGVGEMTIDRAQGAAEAEHAGDSSLLSGAVGWNITMIDGPGFGQGSQLALAIRGEGSLNELKVEGKRGAMPNLTMNTWRGRVVLQGTYDNPVGPGASLVPALEVGMRYDGGQAYSGAGVELGGSVRYDDIPLGVTVEARGRALVALEDSSTEWGVGGLVRVASDQDGHGPFLNVSPSYGDMGGSIAWNSAPTLAAGGGRLNAEWGYGGLRVDGVPGVLTPYGALSLANGGSSYRWGGRLAVTDDLNVNLEAQHSGDGGGSAEHRAVLSAKLRL